MGRNQDDHVKNIAFLMNQRGTWRLSPAFDLTYAWNPDGIWTSRHQMSINNKRKKYQSRRPAGSGKHRRDQETSGKQND